MCLQRLMKFYHCLFKMLKKDQNVANGLKDGQRAITLNRTGPYLIFFLL